VGIGERQGSQRVEGVDRGSEGEIVYEVEMGELRVGRERGRNGRGGVVGGRREEGKGRREGWS